MADSTSLSPSTQRDAAGVSDEDLIYRFQQDDQQAFVLIVRRFKDALTNFVYRFVGDLDVANDIVQETFLRVYQHKHSYNRVSRFSNWIYTIASNLAKSELRRSVRTRNTSLNALTSNGGEEESEWDVPDTSPTPDARVDTTIHMQLIQGALMKISPTYREMVILRDIQDMAYEEIAEITGLELGTVKSRINRGRAQLQDLLKELHHDNLHS